MDNTGQHIVDAQNQPLHFEELCAQRQLYTNAKNYFYFQLVIAVPIPIGIAVAQMFISTNNHTFSWIFALYGVIASLSEIFFEGIISSLKKTAATVQEQFDVAVLIIDWNAVLIKEKVSPEIIHEYYTKHLKRNDDTNRLYNWYSTKVQSVSTNAATLLCQRTNCTYDFSIRKKFIYLIAGIGFFTLLVILCAANAIGITLPVFFTNVALPILPLTLILIKQFKLNDESIKNLAELQEIIENRLANLGPNEFVPTIVIRQIQDKIFCNRITSPLMPNNLYSILWSKLEIQMDFAIETKINELHSAQQ